MNEDIKINASDIKELLEGDGDITGTVEKFIDEVLKKALETLEENESPNFIIGKVIVVNDLTDEDEESEDDESEDEDETEGDEA